MIHEITTRRLSHVDEKPLEAALALLNRTQGQGLFESDYLTRRLHNPECLVLAAFCGAELVGISVVEIIKNFDYFLPFIPNLQQELADKRVASFTTLSVKETFQGRGIGHGLSRERMNWVRDHVCDVALGVSWISGLKHTSNWTFAKVGFRPIKTLSDFYVKNSLEKPFDCPGCHKVPCTCSATLYRWDG